MWTSYGELFKEAMEYWQSHTCVTFTQKNWDDVPDIKFHWTVSRPQKVVWVRMRKSWV